MPFDAGANESKRKQRRLRNTSKLTDRVKEEFECRYNDAPEMMFLEKDVTWHGASYLVFLMALRNVNHRWNGMRDYGFIRLFSASIGVGEEELTAEDALAKVRAILPDDMVEELEKELKEKEVSGEMRYEF